MLWLGSYQHHFLHQALLLSGSAAQARFGELAAHDTPANGPGWTVGGKGRAGCAPPRSGPANGSSEVVEGCGQSRPEAKPGSAARPSGPVQEVVDLGAQVRHLRRCRIGGRRTFPDAAPFRDET
jgi:hypothetical protein